MVKQWDLELYEQYLGARELKPGSIEKYVRDIRQFFGYLGKRKLDFRAIEDYKFYMLDHYKSTTVNGKIISINMYWHWIKRDDLCVSLVKCQKKYFSAKDFELQDYGEMLTYAMEHRKTKWYLIMRCLGGMGIRVGELRYITCEAVTSGETEIYNKSKMRTILIPQDLQICLMDYCMENHISSGIIFRNKQGTKPLDSSVIWRNLKKIALAVNLDQSVVYPHNFRHLFARVYMDKYNNIMELADILGHSSIETTRLYTIASTETQRKRMNDLGL